MVLDKYKEELIEINLEKSEESLKAAEMMLSNNMLMTALNRTYYSIFYIVTALAKKYDFIFTIIYYFIYKKTADIK